MKYSVAFAAVFAGFAAAQSGTASAPIPTSSISPCILTCSQQAASSAGCSSFADISCVCSSQQFQTDAASCITQTCPDQVQQALGLQQALCGAAGSGSSGIASATATSSATAPASSSSVASVSSQSSVSGSSTSRVNSATSAASSVLNSISSAVASATNSPNAAAGLPSFNFAAAGLWTAVALGGVAVAQLAL
ncbi:CFEM domain protein [Ceratobasidium sp. AG-Ba]|nr:CFEM domain protein [Ceratobasidium sp. AG-Ba]